MKSSNQRKRDWWLQVTFLGGRPSAAYPQLRRPAGGLPARRRREERGVIVDLARDGTRLGIEITAPGLVKLADVNRLLKALGAPRITKAEFAPLVAA
jgi:hypothetical protein